VSVVTNLLSWLALGVFPALLAYLVFMEGEASPREVAIVAGKVVVALGAAVSLLLAFLWFAEWFDDGGAE
jgi:hypothetical protein